MTKSPKKPRQNAAGQEEVSSSARDGNDMLCFDIIPRSSRDVVKEAMKEVDVADALVLLQKPHEMNKSPKKPWENAAGQEEVSSSAQDDNDMLCFDIIKRPRSSQGAVKEAMKEMDAAEALLLLQKLRCKDTSSDALPEVDYSGIEPAVDNPDEVLMACSDKRTSSVECNSHPVVEIEERLSCNAIDSSDVVQKENQKLNKRLEFATVMAVINLMNFKPERNSASVDVCGGTELKLDASEKQAAKGKMSADEPGTYNPGEASGGDNSDEVLTFCPEKSSCSVECYGSGESTSDLKEAASASSAYHYGGTEKSGNEAPVVEDEELSRKHSCQALADCPEKSAVIEVERKNPKLHDLVLDNSVVMQEEKHEVYLDAPAPSNSSEEESSDIIDGEANQDA